MRWAAHRDGIVGGIHRLHQHLLPLLGARQLSPHARQLCTRPRQLSLQRCHPLAQRPALRRLVTQHGLGAGVRRRPGLARLPQLGLAVDQLTHPQLCGVKLLLRRC